MPVFSVEERVVFEGNQVQGTFIFWAKKGLPYMFPAPNYYNFLFECIFRLIILPLFLKWFQISMLSKIGNGVLNNVTEINSSVFFQNSEEKLIFFWYWCPECSSFGI